MATIVDQNTWYSPYEYGNYLASLILQTRQAQVVIPTGDYYMTQLDIPLYAYHYPEGSSRENTYASISIVGLDVEGEPDVGNVLWTESFRTDTFTQMAFGAPVTKEYQTFYPNINVTTDGYAIMLAHPDADHVDESLYIGSGSESTESEKGYLSGDEGVTWARSYNSKLAFTAYSDSIPGPAYDPTPEDISSAPFGGVTFGWSIPDFAGYTFTKYKFYFREQGDAWGSGVEGTNPLNSSAGLDISSFVLDTTYEWRVDYEFEDDGGYIATGPTWTFTMETVNLSGTCEAQGDGNGNLPVDLSGTSESISAAGSGAGGGSGELSGSLDVSLPPTEIRVTKTLYAIANNEFWYESSANVMTELAAANGDLLVSDPMQSTAAFNKVFITNKNRLRVADFANIRLTSEAKISTNVPSHGQVLVQVSTGAKIIVDYIYYDNSATDHYIYGRQVGSIEFDTTNDVLDSDTNVIISGANLSAVDNSPHWYTWTEYNKGEDTSFIGMPEGAQLSCLYRGRIVLAGNPDDPYQWYMSRQANPFDWAYTEGNAQTAIAGGNGDMGKSGDVIKALIPWHDDYLILGCSKSMHVMRGDPARGGSLDSFDNNTGIYGPKSWCFDSGGNLYFYGTGGIYYAPRDIFVNGAGSIQNISKNALPNL